MAKTTNILDLNNRLEKVEKENVAQNSYTSLKNKPKINGVTLTGNKSLADIGAAAAADLTTLAGDVGDKTQLNTTDKSSTVAAINEVNTKVDNITSKIIYDAANTGGRYTQNTDQVINTFTATEAGSYLIIGSQYLPYEGAFRRCELQLMINNIPAKHRVFEAFHTLFVEDFVSLAVGDVVKLRVRTDVDIQSLNTDLYTSFMKVVKL